MQDILKEYVNEYGSSNAKLFTQDISNTLCDLAHLRGQQVKETPFSVKARKNGKKFKGGKPDDITVICSIVTEKH